MDCPSLVCAKERIKLSESALDGIGVYFMFIYSGKCLIMFGVRLAGDAERFSKRVALSVVVMAIAYVQRLWPGRIDAWNLALMMKVASLHSVRCICFVGCIHRNRGPARATIRWGDTPTVVEILMALFKLGVCTIL